MGKGGRRIILIATSKVPVTKEGFDTCCRLIEEDAARAGLEVTGILWTTGPGCSNLAIDIRGEEKQIYQMADIITMALMPAKWEVNYQQIEQRRVCELDFNTVTH